MKGLYLHIPFCEHKCIYCDFYSIALKEHPGKAEAYQRRFVPALIEEISLRGKEHPGADPFSTVFFGGGTPSLLSPGEISLIMDQIRSSFRLTEDAEITLETNPGTVTVDSLKGFRGAGINRISMGIQSFFDDDLQFLSRIHSADTARHCVRDCRKAGYDNVSFDLMFALPSQTPERWRENLRQAVGLEPCHISCYSLIVEPNTPLWTMVAQKQVSPLSPDVDREMFFTTVEFLGKHGYEIYEVSNYAREGFRCRHNLIYWTHNEYLGFGPSAHSYRDGRRWWNTANIDSYVNRIAEGILPEQGSESLAKSQLLSEAIYLGLRSTGLSLSGLEKRYGFSIPDSTNSLIDEYIQNGMAVKKGDLLRLTPEGYILCDEICVALDSEISRHVSIL